jgi:hypothetical protein
MGGVMFFLLRMAFWLGVVCVLLPSGTKTAADNPQIDAKEAVTVAAAAVSDMRGFCARQPDACVAGGKVAVAIGHKAEAGARTLIEFVTNSLSGEPTASAPVPKHEAKAADEKAHTAKVSAKMVPVSTREQGTLTGDDMQPAWRAPVPLPPRRPSV